MVGLRQLREFVGVHTWGGVTQAPELVPIGRVEKVCEKLQTRALARKQHVL
jgi:hypothetical protein